FLDMKKLSFSWLGAAFVLASACGGSVEPILGPTSPDPTGAPGAPGGPSSESPPPADTTQPAPTKLPKVPIGPYTAVVATTAVSILYPMPTQEASKNFVRPTEIGDHGPLLAESSFAVFSPGATNKVLDRVHGDSGYANLALISIRLDPCSAR